MSISENDTTGNEHPPELAEGDDEREDPELLGVSETAAYTRKEQRRSRHERRAAKRERAALDDDEQVVSVYAPDVRYIPPMVPYLKSLWERRAFMYALAQSKIKSSRAGTLLGPLWAFVDPLFQVVIYFFLFTVIRGGSGRPDGFLPMLVFGILHFQVSAAAVSEGGNSVTSGANLMLNSTFPRALLPISAILGGCLKFLPAVPVLIVAVPLLGGTIDEQILWWPLLFGLQLLVGLAMALLVSTLVVFFRDVTNLLGYVSRMMFFTAPVIFPADLLSDSITSVLRWGPLYGIFANYQRIVTGRGLDVPVLWISVAWATIGLVIGGWVFLRHEREFGAKI